VIAIVGFSILGSASILKVIEGSHECNSDSDCDGYCGSDFKCHAFPVIENTVHTSWTVPAAILGLAIIIAAFVLRRKNEPRFY